MYLVLGGLEGEYPEPSVAAVGSFLVVCEDLVDGVRLNIDGKLVINGWMNQAYTTYTYRTNFSSAADYTLRLEYFENTGNARVSFRLVQG